MKDQGKRTMDYDLLDQTDSRHVGNEHPETQFQKLRKRRKSPISQVQQALHIPLPQQVIIKLRRKTVRLIMGNSNKPMIVMSVVIKNKRSTYKHIPKGVLYN